MRFPDFKKAKFVKGIPKTWCIESLKEHITIVRGKSYTSEEIDDNNGDHAFINLKNMKRNGGFRLDGTKFFSGKFKKEQVVMPGDIVMAVTDMTQDRLIVGRVARVPLTEYKEYIIEAENLIWQFTSISQNNNLNYLNNLNKLEKYKKYTKLNNIYYEYDMLICKINTEYNKDSDKMNVELLKDHNILLEYLYKLKAEHMDDDIINFIIIN